MIQMKLSDRIAHGFLEASGLRGLGLGKVRCYQSEEFHTGFTLFSPDEQTSVYVQMYGLPDGEEKLAKDLEFQLRGKLWGKLPKGDALTLKIFPADWTHAVFSESPKRVVHCYRGPHRAVFIRYVGKSLKELMFIGFNQHLRYLCDDWHLELVNRELGVPTQPYEEPPATVDAVDLRIEQQGLRQMILEGVKRFAADQRVAGGDVEGLPVTGMQVYFDVGNGHASVHLDVRSPSLTDGAYSHQEYSASRRDNWRQMMELFCQGHPVKLTGLDGKSKTAAAKSDFDFDAAFGEMIVELVKSLQREKAFRPLLIAPGTELFIESHDATFVWPTGGEERLDIS